MSCISFRAYSCGIEDYPKNKKMLITSSVFKFVLGLGSTIFGFMMIDGKDNAFMPAIYIISGVVLIVSGIFVLVDMKQERKRIENNQTIVSNEPPKTEEEK